MPRAKKKPEGALELFPYDKPLWCVYGHECFPQIVCCIINNASGIEAIWGYSVWKKQPGFRTLGISFSQWLRQHPSLCEFFDEQEKAMSYLNKLVTPKVKK
jgi:hypothetical protein